MDCFERITGVHTRLKVDGDAIFNADSGRSFCRMGALQAASVTRTNRTIRSDVT